MFIFNILIALFASLTAIISFINVSNEEITKAEKRKNIWLIVLAILILILTVINVFLQKAEEKSDKEEKKQLHGQVRDIQYKLNTKIKSDIKFEVWLKDTFGIIKQGDSL